MKLFIVLCLLIVSCSKTTDYIFPNTSDKEDKDEGKGPLAQLHSIQSQLRSDLDLIDGVRRARSQPTHLPLNINTHGR